MPWKAATKTLLFPSAHYSIMPKPPRGSKAPGKGGRRGRPERLIKSLGREVAQQAKATARRQGRRAFVSAFSAGRSRLSVLLERLEGKKIGRERFEQERERLVFESLETCRAEMLRLSETHEAGRHALSVLRALLQGERRKISESVKSAKRPMPEKAKTRLSTYRALAELQIQEVNSRFRALRLLADREAFLESIEGRVSRAPKGRAHEILGNELFKWAEDMANLRLDEHHLSAFLDRDFIESDFFHEKDQIAADVASGFEELYGRGKLRKKGEMQERETQRVLAELHRTLTSSKKRVREYRLSRKKLLEKTFEEMERKAKESPPAEREARLMELRELRFSFERTMAVQATVQSAVAVLLPAIWDKIQKRRA